MQPLSFKRGPRSPTLELQRCAHCGGLWFDAGELEATLGHPVHFEALEATVERLCATCQIPMGAALLPGGVPVETCDKCRGTFLDCGELAALGGREPPPPRSVLVAAEPEPDAPLTEKERLALVGFDCAACGRRAPKAQAAVTSRGLVCQACTPQAPEMPWLPGAFEVDIDDTLDPGERPLLFGLSILDDL